MEIRTITPALSVSPQIAPRDGGALLPSFPRALIDGTQPSRLAWFLKETMLPPIYWKAMLRGKEWMAKPEKLSASTA